MQNEVSYEFVTCKRDGAMWLEEVTHTPATRWEPEDYDINPLPCPICNSENDEDPLYVCDAQYGEFANAVLEGARVIAYAIECWGLPHCSTCGESVYDGYWSYGSDKRALCWQCGEREADEYFKREEFDYVVAQQYNERLKFDYFFEHGGNYDEAIREFRDESAAHRLMRVTDIIAALYWRLAFGVGAVECPNCLEHTINAWQDADVWNCYPCCRADAEWEARAEALACDDEGGDE